MEPTNNIPAELLEALDPSEPIEPLRLPRQAWLDLVQRGRCETKQHLYIWHALGVMRISRHWLGHPEAHNHWEDVVCFVEEVYE